jgi:hypothetical protein
LPAPAADARPGFLASRWRGQVPLPRLLWREMLGWGTAINLGFSALALALLAAGVSAGVAVAVHFAPVPWNLFLVAAVWRHAQSRAFSRALAAVWLLAMTVV